MEVEGAAEDVNGHSATRASLPTEAKEAVAVEESETTRRLQVSLGRLMITVPVAKGGDGGFPP